MDELNKKIEALEQSKKEKQMKQKQAEEEELRKDKQRKEDHKNLLGNLKAFDIEDI